ncbi:precorrin-8X methylmutase [Halanaerobium hydrogeniformans]|uniref:Precorrin-8X methylmutase CbiC/CobH n=1 Tax=Halanaerobium hydrogeniformans TaxID=656519 RepID=E4RKA2_HALHG|nr:precorrin-8X methylmutase [Halanaerobium hydrogeniformans]ADQ15615.1 Precorrin-8X methylmutase CbiC/CobH [Halanaerobium hydrogeniformans]
MEENNPREIEAKSMRMIDEEIGNLNCTEAERKTIKRVVHASADTDLATKVSFSPGAAEKAQKLIREGADIITDVTMLKSGINERKLAQYGGELKCFIRDEKVMEAAEKTGLTRSIMAVRKAAKLPGKKIFAIGNAPTALFELLRLNEEENLKIDFIVGTPVGFVGAAESKEELMQSDIPHISLEGRKGGSAIAASIVNSILYMMGD